MSGPFELLGLSPTRDASAVKRAYFHALEKHPPHADPEGFRRVRAAYEELSRPGALAAAFARAPFDVGAAFEAYERRYRDALERAGKAARSEENGATVVARFVERYSRLTLEEAISR